MKKYKTAKEIYMSNGCSHYYISREGYMEEYIRLGGNNFKNEQLWRKEYIHFWFKNINKDEFTAFGRLGDVRATEILDKLLEYNNFPDDFVKFWYSYMLLELARNIFNPLKKRKVKKSALNILENLTNKEIFLLPQNKEKITSDIMHSLEASNENEYLINYSKRLIKEN